MEPDIPGDDTEQLTTYHVRRALEGEAPSLEWVVNRFAPLLLANARYRLGKTLSQIYDPEDIVNDVWAVALPKLADLPARNNRYTPVVMKFLSTTLVYRINNLVEKHIKGKPRNIGGASAGDTEAGSPLDRISTGETGVFTVTMRHDTRDEILSALNGLEERDRELILLRGVEGQSYKEIAVLLGGDPKQLAVTYQRAIHKLRELLPGSIFQDFDSD
ncbi:MAG: sigma-70 family RNA polymerase sigma factor [Planctomycetota bacterium]